jgi:type II secretion system protein C
MALLVGLWLQFIVFPKYQSTTIQAVTAPTTQLINPNSRPKPSSFHLFGSSSTTEVSLDMFQSETSLDLIITGIFASNDPAQGWAYIRSRQGDEKKFKVGDDVFGLATLDAIHDDYLLLRRAAGQKEKLTLSKNRMANTEVKPAVTTTGANKSESAARIANHINKSDDWQSMLNDQKYDPNKIAKMAGNISVVTDGQGQIAGLKVSQLSGLGNLAQQGLRANDQIVAVNGVKISYQNILNLRQQLESSSSANVTVMRNGKELNLNLNLSELQQ